MKHRISALFVLGMAFAAQSQTTSFTYQGSLTQNGAAVTGPQDFEFRLYEAVSGGVPVGLTVTQDDVGVTNGLFSVLLNFGGLFDGSNRFLDISLRPGASSGSYTALAPRQAITATPYAVHALSSASVAWSSVTGVPVGLADGVDADTTYSAGAGLTLAGTQFSIAALGVDTARLADNAVSSAKLADSIDLGNAANNGSLQLFRTTAGTRSILLNGGGSQISTYGSDGLEQIRLWGPSWAELWLNDETGNETTVYLTAGSSAGGKLHARNGAGADRAIVDGGGINDGGELRLYNSNNGVRLRLLGNAPDTDTPANASGGGGIEVFEADGTRTIALRGEEDDLFTGVRGVLKMYDSSGSETVSLESQNGTSGSYLRLAHTDGDAGITAGAGAGGGSIRVWNDTQVAQVFIQGGSGVDSGKIGINRIPSANALEIDGNASKTTAGDWLANSDVRIKTDIHAVSDALKTLEQVRLVSFRYTDEYRAKHAEIADHRYLNVVAQEFAGVFPDHVRAGGDQLASGDHILQVDTYPLTIYSAAAIQELSREGRAKENRITELERQNAELLRRLEIIEQRMK